MISIVPTVSLIDIRPAESAIVIVCEPSSSETTKPVSERRIFRIGCDGVDWSSIGTSPVAHHAPDQIGREVSPASNSIQTPAPTGGIA